MAYSTQAELISVLSESEIISLASETTTIDTAAAAVIAKAIEDADTEINSYCSNNYDVPFITVPDLVNKLSAESAIVNLYHKRGNFSDSVKERRKWIDSTLKNIASGAINLQIDSDTDSAETKCAFYFETSRGWI